MSKNPNKPERSKARELGEGLAVAAVIGSLALAAFESFGG